MFTEPLQDVRCFIFIISWRPILFLTQILLPPTCKTKELRLRVVAKLIRGHAMEGVILNSVQFSHSAVSDSLWPHGLQYARLPCPSPTPRAYSHSCPLIWWISVMPSNHLILCCPLLLLPSIFPSIRVFSSESVLRIRWPKYWSFSFNINPSSDYSGLISGLKSQHSK